jgi:hypothetical protein
VTVEILRLAMIATLDISLRTITATFATMMMVNPLLKNILFLSPQNLIVKNVIHTPIPLQPFEEIA